MTTQAERASIDTSVLLDWIFRHNDRCSVTGTTSPCGVTDCWGATGATSPCGATGATDPCGTTGATSPCGAMDCCGATGATGATNSPGDPSPTMTNNPTLPYAKESLYDKTRTNFTHLTANQKLQELKRRGVSFPGCAANWDVHNAEAMARINLVQKIFVIELLEFTEGNWRKVVRVTKPKKVPTSLPSQEETCIALTQQQLNDLRTCVQKASSVGQPFFFYDGHPTKIVMPQVLQQMEQVGWQVIDNSTCQWLDHHARKRTDAFFYFVMRC